MQRAAIGDVTLAYEIAGTGEPVILIHGALIADSFRPLLVSAGNASQYQLVNYHRRGYGRSDRVSGVITIADQADDCVALLRHLNLGPVHVVGHSYGGAIALQLALDHPGMVHSLALLEPALIAGKSGPEYRKSLAQGGELYRSVETETLVHQFLHARWSDYRETLDRVLPGAFAQAVIDAETAFEYELSSLLDWHFTETEARQIQQPTLSVLGGDSHAFSPRFDEVHQLLQQWIPNAEGITIPGVTHFLTIQDPEAVSDGLVAFWKRHPITS
jgi:pimeloyl-ACP methyl ester carboxylesterase